MSAAPAARLRVKSGRPQGGEFARHEHTEADLELADDREPTRATRKRPGWTMTVDRYAVWVQENGRHPRSPPAGTENALAQWASKQRRDRRGSG